MGHVDNEQVNDFELNNDYGERFMLFHLKHSE